MADQAITEVPAVIQLRDGSVLATINIVRFYQSHDSVIFVMSTGELVRDYWPTGQGDAAFAGYCALLGMTTITGAGLVPNIFNLHEWSPSSKWPASIYGTGFNASLNPTVTFLGIDPLTSDFGPTLVTVVSPFALSFESVPTDPNGVVEAGAYEVWYADDEHQYDANPALNEAIAIPGGATVTDVPILAMQMYYGDSDTPTADPADTTLAACYRGRTHNTVWLWDTEELAWFPVVSV